MPRPKKTWLKAECWVTQATLEVAQSAFLEANAIGIEIDDGIGPEGQIKYADGGVLIKVYFESKGALKDEISEIVNRFFCECGFDEPHIDFADFAEEDWQGNFVKSCTTFKVEPDIYIVPSFEIEAFKKQPKGPLYIEMDPENAFGTGQHQTTKLCLTNIYKHLMDKAHHAASLNCLDVGTGSGILAILMKKLGVRSVLATETDEEALLTAQKNASKNCVSLITAVVDEKHVYDQAAFDFVVANILAPVLIDMSENLSMCLRPQGTLILSGILVPQAPLVIDAYTRRGLTFAYQDTMDDWCALVFVRKQG